MKRVTPPSPAATQTRLRVTSEGWLWLAAAGVVGFLGWWKSINAVFLLAYFMLALVPLNAVLARLNVRRVRAVREPLPPIHAGEDAVISVTVANDRSRSATVVVEDMVAGKVAFGLIVDLPAGARVPCRLRRSFASRGPKATRLRILSGSPFGLVETIRSAIVGELLVLPAIGVVEANGLRRWLLRNSGGGNRSRKAQRALATDQADVRGVRAYRSGDAFNTIHWRSSARRGELMVREYDAARAVDLVLVVEPWLPATHTPLQAANLEAALSLAATIAANWRRVYDTRITLAVAGDGDSVSTTVPDAAAVRVALAPLARTAGGDDFPPLLPEAFNRPLGQAARLVVSSRPDTPYASALSHATGRRFMTLCPTDRLPWYEPPTARVEGA